MEAIKMKWKAETSKKCLLAAFFLVFCLAIGIPGTARAAEDTIESLDTVYITGFMKNAPGQKLHWVYSGKEYDSQPYFFIPAGADTGQVQIWFARRNKNQDGSVDYITESGSVTINGQKVSSGDTIMLPDNNGKLPITAGNGETVTVGVKYSADIAAMFVNTQSGSMGSIHADKDHKEKGNMLLVQSDGSLNYQGELKHIKGRGNATWDMEKKPYNIKLSESADLLGMGSAKGWCLLANYTDTSLLRNQIVYNLAEETGIPFTMDSRSVDLYLNGKYNGTYLMTEKVEIDKNRVNVTDMEKATEKVNTDDLDSYPAGGTPGYQRQTRKWVNIPNDPEDITGGYLIELELFDRYAAEACGFVTKIGQSVTMKAPEFVSERQIHYIADFYQDMEDAVYSKTGYNAKGKHFTEYIDERSIAKMYLLQEYSLNLDTGITSFYLYKDSDKTGDGKLHMAPVWDFDMSIGNCGTRDGVYLADPEVWWANRAQIYQIGGLNLLAQAVQYDSVKRLVVEEWNEVFRPAVRALLKESGDYPLKKLRTISSYKTELQTSADMNFLVWSNALNHPVTGIQNGTDFSGSVDYIKDFLTIREAFLHREFAYGGNMGYDRITGTVWVEGTLQAGEQVTAQVAGSNAKEFIYQWLADGEEIAGATEAGYLLTEAEVGKEISVRVSAKESHLLHTLVGVGSEKVQGQTPEPKPEPGPHPNPNPDPDPDPNPNPDSGQTQVPAQKTLAASGVLKVDSTKYGVKIQFGRSEHAGAYEIYRTAGTSSKKIAVVTSLVFTDSNPVGNQKMTYTVKAISGDPANYTDAGFGAAKSIKLPKTPKKPKVKALKDGRVSVSFQKIKGVKTYLIYRADSKNGTYKLIKKVKKANTYSYIDKTNTKKGRKYYYKIAALKNGTYSPLSSAVKVKVKK